MQGWLRQQTCSPEMEETLRRVSSWKPGELILKVDPSTLRGRMAADPSLPQGLAERKMAASAGPCWRRTCCAASPMGRRRPCRSPRPSGGLDPHRARVSRGKEVSRVTATGAMVEIRMSRDFAGIERGRLKAAVAAFLSGLDSDG